jgi:hypothetical protein
MVPTIDTFLTSVRERRPSIKGGIALALDYMAALGPCLGDDQCADKFFGVAKPDEWDKALKDASSKLVYRAKNMTVLSAEDLKDKAFDGFQLPRTEKACLDFACVLTSTSKDRDGDILESAGAIIDPKMPLLWQHIPLQPIGKLTQVIKQGQNKIYVAFAVIDSPLGRDAAQLFEFGALRISHGFKPLKFEPLEPAKGDQTKPGWHVKEYEVMEGSGVSIPSNTEAVLIALSRDKLHHPLVKRWAEAIKAGNQTVMVKGGWEAAELTGSLMPAVNVHVHFEQKAGEHKNGQACGCTTGTKAQEDAAAVKATVRRIPGEDLKALIGAVITAVEDKDGDDVSIQCERAGRVLSSSNAQTIGTAATCIGKAQKTVTSVKGKMDRMCGKKGNTPSKPDMVGLLSKASGKLGKALGYKADALKALKAVLDANSQSQQKPQQPQAPQTPGANSSGTTQAGGSPVLTVNDLAARLIGVLAKGGDLDVTLAKALRKALKKAIKNASYEELAEALEV